MTKKVVVAGVGMIPLRKPTASASYVVMGAQAARLALADARAGYESMQQAFVGYVHGDSTAGQRVLYDLGFTGIPIFNTRNGGASGSSALWMARQAIASGEADIALALGFEQLNPGAPQAQFANRPSPLEPSFAQCDPRAGGIDIPPALRIFGAAGLEHMKRFGTPLETFAKIRAKASRHAANNPLAMSRNILSPEQVLADTPLWPGVMTRAMASAPACGAAAAVLCSEAYARQYKLDSRIWIAGQAMTTVGSKALPGVDASDGASYSMSRAAARSVYEQAGIGADDLDVVELHDCVAHNELLSYESLDLCPEGGAQKFVDSGNNTYGGRYVVNPSGGLLGRGHALGATGLAQCFELVQQLRGQAGKRQVEGARIALQHNVGIGGAAVVTMYRN
ncbi:beta-ketoacyl synthase N-terminal-like domain-containing protein [Variovorax robiniae]|uniref:Beta-ketoacyl synthase N-terminal-like domain-containing protein n=1 Tax=Variovorax robiniae TaxID=1836199 RepID=A0ABU8XG25_9BURK